MYESTEICAKLQKSLHLLAQILRGDIEIDNQSYCEEVGHFSKELNLLLHKYFKVNEEARDKLRPWINYYRQLQHYLIFLVRNEDILKIPHHSEILQTVNFIENQEKLIEDIYFGISKVQKGLFSNEFLQKLDKLLEEKIRRMM